jgi:long-chain acyl-CoA synthetase
MKPDNTEALVSSRSSLLKTDFETKLDKVANFLSRQSLGPLDLVATRLPSDLEVIFACALERSGIASGVLGPGITTGPIKPDLVISIEPGDAVHAGRFILADTQLLRSIDSLEPKKTPSVDTPLAIFTRLIFSSGTTGGPKAVAFTQDMLENRARTGHELWMSKSNFMCLLGVGSSSGYLTLFSNVKLGQPYFVPGSAAENFDLIKKHEIRLITASPNQISALVDVALDRGERLPSLELIQSAGSFLPNHLAHLAEKILGGKVRNLYGSTEVGLVSTRDEIPEDPSFTGTVLDDVEVEIVNEHDEVLQIGEMGIVRCRKPGMATEYYMSPEATKLAFKDGWFYPGDRGRLDSNRGLYLAGRVSEAFNSGGVKIDPIRIDNFAIEYPGVADAAAFVFADDRAVQKIALAVVTKGGFDVIAFVAKLKSIFGDAHPTVVFRIDEIPRNETGKVLRSQLTELYNSVRKS